MQIKNILIKKDIKLHLLEHHLLEQLIKYSYNHFKSLKRTFNSNICKSINIVSFGRVAMLECFKRCTNKIFILKGYKNIIILKIIIIKIIVLIRDNVNDIKYQKPQKLTMG